MSADLFTVSSAELLARLAGVAVIDEDAAGRIAQLFRDMHAAMGECTCNGPYQTSNHQLEYVVAQSSNAAAKRIHAEIHVIRRGILLRRQATTRMKIELQLRGVPTR